MCKLVVYGLVQGVGFRPYVAELGRQLNIRGTVKNVGGIVHILACANRKVIEDFSYRLSSFDGKNEALPGARVDRINTFPLSWEEYTMQSGNPDDFVIAPSGPEADRIRILPADVATCERCAKELTDPDDRRYHHPFISCVSCGPRYSIMERVPYDRESLTMKIFPFCPQCRKEYRELHNIRRHAQTIACKDCGPKLFLYTLQNGKVQRTDSKRSDDALLQEAAKALKEGKILAIKNVGGYHFAFDPYNQEAAMRLRQFKDRERKPFAILFPDIDLIEQYGEVSALEKELLHSPQRPIVLIKKRTIPKGQSFTPGVCDNSSRIGAMLPCDPVQILLMERTGPLVMTSGNLGGEPIVTDDDHMLSYLREDGIDMILGNDRPIYNGLDDSVLQVIAPGETQQVQIIRRARGYVPEPVFLETSLEQDTFAAGGDLKAVFALGRETAVYLSGHYGDLMDYRALTKRREGTDHMEELLGITPESYVCDLHPGYVSVQETKNRGEERVTRIQHHYAHIASVMAEHNLRNVLGFAFDGTGYGTDQAVWGGECLLCTMEGFDRVGQLSYVALTGGDAAARNARQVAYCYGLSAMEQGCLTREEVPFREEAFAPLVEAARKNALQTVQTSSMGRLFDAVAAILELGYDNSYEGECPQLVQAAAEAYLEERNNAGDFTQEKDLYQSLLSAKECLTFPVEVRKGQDPETPVLQGDTDHLIADLIRRKNAGEAAGKLALEFHAAIARLASSMADMVLSRGNKVQGIALSGGSMNNRLLLGLLYEALGDKGLPVYTNEKVPCGDGGIALGQMYLMTR